MMALPLKGGTGARSVPLRAGMTLQLHHPASAPGQPRTRPLPPPSRPLPPHCVALPLSLPAVYSMDSSEAATV